MTKEEKIKEAYAHHYNPYIDENGWFDMKYYNDIFYNDCPFELWDRKNNKIRPKSLQGIEENNRWIKIESEDDLPKEYGLYWTVSDGEIGIDNFKDEFDKKRLAEEYTDGNLTHYQPIEKPKPPLY